ncbi:protein lifeguard 4 isoform X1 [Monodelphis domestica]|uniref:protein lifeguard 4 isoform X1 n=1 Tax=Monodelphis domestica TaxID=13616 RepID=UPI0024E2741C|nr:protein lifeguard 4 isoform X1 [Monodelphis domestica]
MNWYSGKSNELVLWQVLAQVYVLFMAVLQTLTQVKKIFRFVILLKAEKILAIDNNLESMIKAVFEQLVKGKGLDQVLGKDNGQTESVPKENEGENENKPDGEPEKICPLEEVTKLSSNAGVLHSRTYRQFTLQELESIKSHFPKFVENSFKSQKALKRAFRIFDPNFEDVEFLLSELFSPHEQRQFLEKTRSDSNLTSWPTVEQRVDRNFANPTCMSYLRKCREDLLQAIKLCCSKPNAWARFDKILQNKGEHPATSIVQLSEMADSILGIEVDSEESTSHVCRQFLGVVHLIKKFFFKHYFPKYDSVTLIELHETATYLHDSNTEQSKQVQDLKDKLEMTENNLKQKEIEEIMRLNTVKTYTTSSYKKPSYKEKPVQKETRECFFCHKKGHLIRNCFLKKKYEINNKNTQNSQTRYKKSSCSHCTLKSSKQAKDLQEMQHAITSGANLSTLI